MHPLRIDTNLSLEFSYTASGTYVKILRQGLKFPLRGDDIRLGPNTFDKHNHPKLIENKEGRIILLMPGGEKLVMQATKLDLVLIQGIK